MLITGFTSMVWISVARNAKVLVTFIASDSILGHVLSCLSGNYVTFIILLIPYYLTREHFHDVPTRTANEIWIEFDDLHSLCSLNLILLLW